MKRRFLPMLLLAAFGLAGGASAYAQTQIATAEEFEAFAQAVNAGETTLEAVLTADIELTSNVMIGTEANKYAGTFDGDGHKVTYNYTVSESYCGLFRYVNGATIRNLYVEGDATSTGLHFGALMGYAEGTVLVENVVTNVNITGAITSITGDGGMVGRLEGPITFNNCATLGKMGYAGSSMYCGFVAYAGNGSSALNNCFTACELTEGTGTGYCYTFCRGTATYSNCYYLNAIGTIDGGTQITEDLLASGELCFKLNGDQSTIGWYQNLDGTDSFPVPFASHAQVYANGELKCDGTSAGGALVYSNSETSTIPPHTCVDGWCTVCGTWDATYHLTVDGEGFYNIGNASEFAWYAEFLAQGNPCGNVKLTADIDLSTSNWPNTMIASQANPFTGIFDGQEHTITYNYANVTSSHQGLFRTVDGATIRNLKVEGSATSTNIHFGALMGRAQGTVLVENVVTNVNITGKRSGVTGDAGMVGANYAQLTFNNCATLGEMGYSGTSMYSSYCGWADGASSATLNNCYTTCKLTDGTGTSNCFTLTHGSGTNTFNNCYYLNEIGTVQGTPVAADKIASGEFCYTLNGDQSTINWYQTLGTDAQPVPFASHAQVYANGELKCDGTSAGGGALTYSNSATSVIPPHTFEDGWCSVCGAWDADYLTADSEGYFNIGTAKALAWYNEYLAQGNTSSNVKLTADIDLTTSDYPALMIASSVNKFKGIFDGQGHTVTYSYNISSNYCGLFTYVEGGTIRNLKVKGSVTSTAIHFGALIGRADGTVLVENVITDVNITGKKSGVTGDGGMLGANYANITFNNCATLGKMGYDGSSMYSSFSAYSSSSSKTTLNNCYTLCSLVEGTGSSSTFTLSHGSNNTFNNCYYLNAMGTVQGEAVTAEQVANGELCAMLGAGWYQNIGEDAYPVFDKTHNTVKMITEVGYATMYLPYAVEIPEGVEVFTGEFEEDWLKLNAVAGTVPAFEPVVLKGAAGIYSFAPATTTPDNIEGNVLMGADEDFNATGVEYILAKPEEKPVGFYKATEDTTIKAGKAYLVSSSGVKAFLFAEDEDATGIEKTLSNSPLKGENIYNVAGQKLSKMQKGINIVNGRKVLR